ncbi:hypothetical protein M752DRAFT_265469 [Aspergillus phoenicis ATCC 13157]|uniref:Uncharacterized protein n=1 Tax=Aspergillus phoenicis ATCC 13157 TaxID=1353007 RepID=A0A370PN42_ASPPH|nr:hypothetical protein M752DRAFT_265469 [Aspergillus phoenicis ATCC 13157]
MGVGMSRGLAVSGETEHGGRFMESYSDLRVVFHKARVDCGRLAGIHRHRPVRVAFRVGEIKENGKDRRESALNLIVIFLCSFDGIANREICYRVMPSCVGCRPVPVDPFRRCEEEREIRADYSESGVFGDSAQRDRPLYHFQDLLAAVRYSSSSTETPAGDRLVLSRNILVDGAPSLQIGQVGLMPTKPFPLRAVGDSVGEHQMNIGLVHAVTLAKSPSPPITVGIRWTNQIVAIMQSSCRFDNKEGRRESVQLHRPQHRPRCLIQAEVPPGLVLTLITADMRWPKVTENIGPRGRPRLDAWMHYTTAAFPCNVRPLTPNVLEGATRSTGEDVGCQMLIRRSSLVGTIRLPSGRVPCARPILAGRLREKARDASRAPHWLKGGNPYSLLASLGRLSV